MITRPGTVRKRCPSNCRRRGARFARQIQWPREARPAPRFCPSVHKGCHAGPGGQNARRPALPPSSDPEFLERLNQAIAAALPGRDRDIFLAHRVDGLSYQEIADRTD
ncbi:MAG TPA: sigma-70 region 4 domain-containing protein [Allosphingosinicella sp.]